MFQCMRPLMCYTRDAYGFYSILHEELPAVLHTPLLPWAFRGCPRTYAVQCRPFLLVTQQAVFMNLCHAKASSWNIFKLPASNHRSGLQRASHEPI